MRIRISLNIIEQNLVMKVVEGWKEHAEINKRNRVLIDKKLKVKNTDKESFGAEVAYCKHHKIKPDTRIASFEYYDAVLPDGTTVNVKSTKNPKGNLIVPLSENEKDRLPDIYALMIGEFPIYYYMGWIEQGTIIDDKRINKNLPTPAYFIHRSKLNG